MWGRKRLREHWHNAEQPTELLSHFSKFQGRVEILHQVDHVAFGGALRVPPAVPVVIDDEDLTPYRGGISALAACFLADRAANRPANARAARHS
jgi:hypothetical protein